MSSSLATALSRFRIGHPSLKQWVLPLTLTVLCLIIINVGLYTQLRPQELTGERTLPYNEQFDSSALNDWYTLGGNWEILEGQLVQSSAVPEPLGIVAPVSVIGAQPYRLDTTLTLSGEADGGGLLFNLQYPRVRQNSHVARLARENGQMFLVTGFFDPFKEFHPQASVRLDMNHDAEKDVRFSILAGLETYAVLINDEVVVRDLPLVFHGGWVGLDTVKGPVSFDSLALSAWFPAEEDVPMVSEQLVLADEVSAAPAETGPVQVTIAPRATGDTVYASVFEGDLETSGWIRLDGDWINEGGSLVQREPQGYDHAVVHEGPFSNYILRVNLHHLQGSGGGVLFNMPNINDLRGAHLVRYTDTGEGVFWGYFDESGTFVGQGFAPTSPPGTGEHLLEITSTETTYAITLDGQMLAQDVPLQTSAGHIGLTSSQSAVAFDDVTILELGGAQTQATGVSLDTMDLSQANGNWREEEGVVIQEAGDATDYFIDTKLSGEQYTASVDVQLSGAPDNLDIGGGLLFNMPAADRKEGADMVRLGSAWPRGVLGLLRCHWRLYRTGWKCDRTGPECLPYPQRGRRFRHLCCPARWGNPGDRSSFAATSWGYRVVELWRTCFISQHPLSAREPLTVIQNSHAPRSQLWPRIRGATPDWILQPFLAFLISRTVIFFGGYLAEIALPSQTGEGFWHAVPDNLFLDIWARWDSGFYLRIIEEGYLFIIGQQSNVAFFPLYPLLASFLNHITNNSVLAGVIVSHLCFLFALIFLYLLTDLEFDDQPSAQRAVFYISIFPTAFFFSAVYTESTFLLFSVATFYFARRQMWAWAALMGMLTGVSRIIGVAMWGVVMLEWMRANGWTISTAWRRKPWQDLWLAARRQWTSLLVISIIPLGLLSHMVFLWRTFQDPLAFWTVQSAWARENLGPVAIVLRDIQPLLSQSFLLGEIWWHVIIDVSALIFALVMVFVLWRRLGESYAIYCLLGVIIPASSGTGSISRYILVLFPLFMMLGLWGRHTTLDRVLTISFATFLGIFTAIFVNWFFVA